MVPYQNHNLFYEEDPYQESCDQTATEVQHKEYETRMAFVADQKRSNNIIPIQQHFKPVNYYLSDNTANNTGNAPKLKGVFTGQTITVSGFYYFEIQINTCVYSFSEKSYKECMG